MALASMTGFSRAQGTHDTIRWTWELRSVNGKNLDIRMRLPTGLEAIEAEVKARCGKVLRRGNVSIGLSMQRDQGQAVLQVNEEALASVLSALELLKAKLPDAMAPSLDGILAHKGVLELKEPEDDEAARKALQAALLENLDEALTDLVAMRRGEGAAILTVISGQVDTIEKLTKQAEALPGRSTEAIRARLADQIAELMEASAGALDPQRLHQEAAILATKADIREELDRLHAHVAAARDLLNSGGAIGRRFDFLAQEFNRETNTLCSKSNIVDLTAIGLELKAVIDQMREQIQNLE